MALTAIDTSNWGNAAEWVASIGAILAFGATVWLLTLQRREIASSERARLEDQRRTSEQLELAREQAESARRQEVLRIRPMLAARSSDVLLDFDANGRLTAVGATFRNIGEGTALVRSLGLRAGDLVAPSGKMSEPVVPPGASVLAAFTELRRDGARVPISSLADNQRPFEVAIGYTNATGHDALRTVAHVHYTGEARRPWRVRQLFFYEGTDTEPFASTGPADL